MKLLLSIIVLATNIYSSTEINPNDVKACPSITLEAQEIINSINDLESQLNPVSECEDIGENLQTLSSAMSNPSWKRVSNLIKNNGTAELENNEIDDIKLLITNASSSLGSVLAGLKSRKNCLHKSNKLSFASKLSGVVRTVTGVLGNITGPYGMAVSLSGDLLSGAILNISDILGKKTYNFKKNPEQIELFRNQFCAFTEIHKDISDYLSLENRKVELDELGKYLTLKISSIEKNCSECKGIGHALSHKRMAKNLINSLRKDSKIVSYENEDERKYYSRCIEINRALYIKDSSFDRYLEFLKNYKNPSNDESQNEFIKSIYLIKEDLKEIFPPLSDCLKLSREKKFDLAKMFNSIMRDEVLKTFDELFVEFPAKLVNKANKRFVSPLGDYTYMSYDRKMWVGKERNSIQSRIKSVDYYDSQTELKNRLRKIESHFVKFGLPDYLEFKLKKSKKSFGGYFKSLNKYERNKNKNCHDLNSCESDNRVSLTEKGRVDLIFDASYREARSVHRYCEFITFSQLSTFEIEKLCLKDLSQIKNQLQYFIVNHSLQKVYQNPSSWNQTNEVIPNFQNRKLKMYFHS